MQYVHVPPCDREAGCIPQGMGQQALSHVSTHSDSLSDTITVPLQLWELTSQEGKGRRAKDPPILLHVQYLFTYSVASSWPPTGSLYLQCPFHTLPPQTASHSGSSISETPDPPSSPHFSETACGLRPEIKMAAKPLEHGEMSPG